MNAITLLSLFSLSAHQSPTHTNVQFIYLHLSCVSHLFSFYYNLQRFSNSFNHISIPTLKYYFTPLPFLSVLHLMVSLFPHAYHLILPEQLCNHGSNYPISVSSHSPHTVSPLLFGSVHSSELRSSLSQNANLLQPKCKQRLSHQSSASDLYSLAPPTVPFSPFALTPFLDPLHLLSACKFILSPCPYPPSALHFTSYES